MFVNRWTITGFVLIIATAATISGLAALEPSERPGVTKANADRIRKGMTRKEVDAILGGEGFFSGCCTSAGGVFAFEKWWHEDGAEITVVFFDDAVTRTVWTESTETIPQKLRRWMHLPK